MGKIILSLNSDRNGCMHCTNLASLSAALNSLKLGLSA